VEASKSSVDIVALHQALVDALIAKECITSPEVEAAFRAVPRHPFLPAIPLEEVYADDAIPTKFDEDGRAISSSSQPAMMAIMLEQLALQPGQQVLEVGAGTGYNAALMGYLVGEHGRVTALDIDLDIVEMAQANLAAVGVTHVEAVCADGMEGYAPNAPYDRIILTVGGWEIAPAWLEQLKPDGRILLPLSLNGPQYAIAFARQGDHLASVSVKPCGFMRLRGPNAGPDKTIALTPNIQLGYEERPESTHHLNPEMVRQWLAAPWQDTAADVELTIEEGWRSLFLWLAIHEPHLVDIAAQGTAEPALPFLYGRDGAHPWQLAVGLVTADGLAFYTRPPGERPLADDELSAQPQPFALHIRSFGEGETATHQLRQHAQNWHRAGRPDAEKMRVRVYPIQQAPPSVTAVTRRWHKFVIDWID
jgi:protein-L-isoaspartate(D-aspartate) O-methyltransferase